MLVVSDEHDHDRGDVQNGCTTSDDHNHQSRCLQPGRATVVVPDTEDNKADRGDGHENRKSSPDVPLVPALGPVPVVLGAGHRISRRT